MNLESIKTNVIPATLSIVGGRDCFNITFTYTLIGRGTNTAYLYSKVIIENDPFVSRHHCTIVFSHRNVSFYIIDGLPLSECLTSWDIDHDADVRNYLSVNPFQRSKAGTAVNGRDINVSKLNDRDVITVGRTDLLFNVSNHCVKDFESKSTCPNVAYLVSRNNFSISEKPIITNQ